MNTKHCSTCGLEKAITDFYWSNKNRGTRIAQCKTCKKKYENQHYIINADVIKQKQKSRYAANKIYYQQRYIKNRSYLLKQGKEYRKNNPNKISYMRKQWRIKNPTYTADWIAKKKTDSPMFRLNSNIRCLIYISVKGNKNGQHWELLVGYTLKQLKVHLEALFQPGMSWDNYGRWHIDHIIPMSLWQFEKPEDREFKQCWALCNLQPLWAKENLRKYNKCHL